MDEKENQELNLDDILREFGAEPESTQEETAQVEEAPEEPAVEQVPEEEQLEDLDDEVLSVWLTGKKEPADLEQTRRMDAIEPADLEQTRRIDRLDRKSVV